MKYYKKIYHTLLCILLLLFICNRNFAQLPVEDSRYPDSMLSVLHQAHTDTARAMVLFRISDHYTRIKGDSAKAMQCILHGLDLVKNNTLYTGIGHFYMGNVYLDFYIKEKWEKSQKEYLTADSLLGNASLPIVLGYKFRTWYNYSLIEGQKGDSKSVINILINKVIPAALGAGDSLRVAIFYTTVGRLFLNNNDFNKALQYFTISAKAFQLLKTKSPLYAEPYIFSSNIYSLNHNFSVSKSYLDTALQILSPLSKSFSLVLYYYAEAFYYNTIGKHNNALLSVEKGITLSTELNQNAFIPQLLYEKARGLKGKKEYATAKKILTGLYEQEKTSGRLVNSSEILLNLAQIDSAIGNMSEAYQWLMKLKVVNDSIYEQKNIVEITALETRYQTAEKEKQILTLQSDKKQQQLVLQKTRFITGLLAIGIISVLIILFFVWKLYSSRKLTARQEQALHEQQITELQQKQQIKVYDAMLQGQEIERNRVARDLHDGLGGMLAGVKLKLSTIANKETAKTTDMELYKVITQLDQSVSELRRIARNMMPETLMQFGIEPALKDLCTSLQTAKLTVEFEALGVEDNISKSVQITIYRIVQELLGNAIKHANATNILVQCTQNSDRFFLTVEDNGNGFDAKKIALGNGIGLSNIRNRVEFLKGKFDIYSEPGEGTTINIEVSINEG